MNPRVTSFADAMAKLPTPDGKRFTAVVDDQNVTLELYAPRGTDPQKPHLRDELYVVAQGSGDFVRGGERITFQPGDVLFAAANVPHRFENFSEDFATWVVFYGPPILETERLRLRVLTGDDFEAHARIQADDETQRYLAGHAMSRFEAFRHMSDVAGHWQLRGYGYWGIEEKETGELIGRVGFDYPEGWPGFELGWTIARDRWGRGYAVEAARRALRHAFENLAKTHVISLIHPENERSIRVATKIGETLEGEAEVNGARVLVYGINASR